MRGILNNNFKSKWHFRLKRKCVWGREKRTILSLFVQRWKLQYNFLYYVIFYLNVICMPFVLLGRPAGIMKESSTKISQMPPKQKRMRNWNWRWEEKQGARERTNWKVTFCKACQQNAWYKLLCFCREREEQWGSLNSLWDVLSSVPH